MHGWSILLASGDALHCDIKQSIKTFRLHTLTLWIDNLSLPIFCEEEVQLQRKMHEYYAYTHHDHKRTHMHLEHKHMHWHQSGWFPQPVELVTWN